MEQRHFYLTFLTLLAMIFLPFGHAKAQINMGSEYLGSITLTRGETKTIESTRVALCISNAYKFDYVHGWTTEPKDAGFYTHHENNGAKPTKFSVTGYAVCSEKKLSCTVYYTQSDGNYVSKTFYYLVTVTSDSYTKKERDIELAAPGTLSWRIDSSDKNTITHLTLHGDLNGDDLLFLRQMAGCEDNKGNLRYLDLRGVHFVAGGGSYVTIFGGQESISSDSYNIPYGAFYWCRKLEEVWLPNKLNSIDYYAFLCCDYLTTVHIPEGTQKIYDGNFQSCRNLKKLTIPSTINTFYPDFDGSYKFETLYCYAVTPPTRSSSSSFFQNIVNLYVPQGCKNDYLTKKGWGAIANIYDTLGFPYIEPTAISIRDSLFMKTTDTYKLSFDYRYPTGISASQKVSPSVSWSSSDPSVVTVFDGTLTPVATGTAVITVESANNLTDNCKVTVIQSEPLKWDIKQVGTGSGHTMILKTDGTLWACGYNTYGQLGDGTTTNIKTPRQVMTDVAAVATGVWHTMILKTDGTLWACGRNNRGQLGDGTTNDCSTPKQVMSGVASVSAGYFHTMILKTDGTLWACGSNWYGQLGDSSTTGIQKPKQVMNGVVAVAGGYDNSMILKTDGTLWVCGYNEFGQLGDGTTTHIKTPKQVMNSVAAMSAGDWHTMIMKTDGTLWACGRNDCGQLGDGTTADIKKPKQVMTGVASVSVYESHTMILKTDGTLWACGANGYGQLGDGTTTDIKTPKQVMAGVTAVSAGYDHTMILKTDGTLWACGSNDYGQLGDGTTVGRSTPVLISGPDIRVGSITLNKTSLSLQAGKTETLVATVMPDNASDKSVTWSSSSSSVATVDSHTGVVTAKAVGSATITCTANDGSGVKATCIVKVIDQDPDNIIYINDVEATAGNQLTLSLRMKNKAPIRGFQFNLYLPDGVTAAKNAKGRIVASLSQERLDEDDEHTLTTAQQDDGSIRFLCGSQYDETFAGNDGEVATITVNIAENMEEGDYTIVLRDVKLTETDISKYYENSEVKATLTISSYTPGDINSDGKVDVSDYIGVANRIMGDTPAGFVEKAGDVDGNGVIDVSDYIGVANIIMTGSIYGSINSRAYKTSTDISVMDNVIYALPLTVEAGATTGRLSICMKNTVPIRGFQFDLYLPDGVTAVKNAKGRIVASLNKARLEADDEHTLTVGEQSDGAIRFLCGSQYDETFTGNDGEVVALDVKITKELTAPEYSIRLKNIKLTETDISKYYETETVETVLTVGISDITASQDSASKVYNLSGQRLAKPLKGINIIGSRKMVVK